jgi:hypothetical protein
MNAGSGSLFQRRGWVPFQTSLTSWATRFRRLVKDYERLPETVAGLHFVAFACLMLTRIFAAL